MKMPRNRLSIAVLFLAEWCVIVLLMTGYAEHAYGQAALIYGNDSVSSPDGVSLPEPTEHWFTQGNGTTTNGTQVPSYWVNKVGGELSDVIQSACALTLNMSAYNQLNTCILSIKAQIAGITGRLIDVTMYNSNASYTPPAGTNLVEVEVVGGGGAGGGAPAADSTHFSLGGGGGGGAYARIRLAAVYISGSVTVTVGSGGAGGGGTGGAGGTSAFGSFASCPGGLGGGYILVPAGQSGPVGIGGGGSLCTISTAQTLINSGGSPGGTGVYFGSALASGVGGSGPYGGGAGNTNGISGTNGNAGTGGAGPGAGGSGAGCTESCPGYNGGGGSGGTVIVRSYS